MKKNGIMNGKISVISVISCIMTYKQKEHICLPERKCADMLFLLF